MKRFAVMALGLLIGGLSCYAYGHQINNDTIIVVNCPSKVTIGKTKNSLSVKVEGSAENPDYFYSHKMSVDSSAAVITEEKNRNWDFTIPFVGKKKSKTYSHEVRMGGFGFGMVNAVGAPEGMDVDMGASYELMSDHLLRWAYYLNHYRTSLSVGLGVTWRNYRMTGRTRFIKEGDNLVLGAYPEGAEIKFSRLKVFSITVPFMLNHSLGERTLFSIGPVVNFNTHASLKTRYVLDGEKVKEKSNQIHQRRMTVDLMARISFRNIGFYLKYSPTHMLNTEFGPEFKSLSTGITLFF